MHQVEGAEAKQAEPEVKDPLEGKTEFVKNQRSLQIQARAERNTTTHLRGQPYRKEEGKK